MLADPLDGLRLLLVDGTGPGPASADLCERHSLDSLAYDPGQLGPKALPELVGVVAGVGALPAPGPVAAVLLPVRMVPDVLVATLEVDRSQATGYGPGLTGGSIGLGEDLGHGLADQP